ncbi:MAG: hypothetical protein EHM42_00200 [Planctomycetaceae bacterium]|nr:MAG: hypothetical protein EHM42_00200 [Planctomycetaceae bacterium]
MTAALLVTIDTEEEGLWGGRFPASGNTVANLRGIPRFQALCDEFSVRPTYLVDTPVAMDDYGADLLGGLQSSGRAEVGAHLHPWCTPPGNEDSSPRDSYLCNLDPGLQRAKLETLVDQITRRCGRRPTSFRAGRYGLGTAAARILVELGFTVDSSVIPFSDFSSEGGPDFSSANWRPYRMAADNILKSDPAGELLEIPVGVGFSRRDFESAWRWRQWASRPHLARFRMVGLMDRLGISHRIKLSPEQADAGEMLTLIGHCVARGSPCVVLMFHSSSLVPGFSPYVPTSRRLEDFFAQLRSVFERCIGDWGMAAPTLSDFALEFSSRAP